LHKGKGLVRAIATIFGAKPAIGIFPVISSGIIDSTDEFPGWPSDLTNMFLKERDKSQFAIDKSLKNELAN